MRTVGVTVDDRRIEIPVGEGETRVLSDLLAESGIPLNTRCDKRGICRGCLVQLVSGSLGNSSGSVAASADVRSCQIKADQIGIGMEINVPPHARLESMPQVSDTFASNVPVALDPPWFVQRGVSDLAVAIDVGTTTVAVAVVDLGTGDVLARAGDFNAQIRFGDNVLTRIVAAGSPTAREQMRHAVLWETIAPLIERACKRAGVSAERLVGGSVAGNTTMLHLLAGEDPSGLGVVPFTPRFLDARLLELPAAERKHQRAGGVSLPEQLSFTLLPGFSAYVGADLAAGVYATGMMCDAGPSLLVDIGTNGEIVLQAGGRLLGCATAAGPAFEGSGLLSGTRAQSGAISHLNVRAEPFGLEVETIDGRESSRAPGLCGTAYVDFLASARQVGLLLPGGRFAPEAWAQVPGSNQIGPEGGRTLRIAGACRISEADIAQLLQAKAAIGAGIETLLEVAGLGPCDVSKVYLAGGFGLYIDVENAIAIGLLPGFRREQVSVVGNTALGGAVLAAVDRRVVPEIKEMRGCIQIVELNAQPGFEDSYLDHLSLP